MKPIVDLHICKYSSLKLYRFFMTMWSDPICFHSCKQKIEFQHQVGICALPMFQALCSRHVKDMKPIVSCLHPLIKSFWSVAT